MIFYPDSYFNSILDVSVEFLTKKNIKAILLDIDNTMLSYDGKTVEGLEEWANKIKKAQIKICILSNTNKKTKAEKLGKLLNVPYIFFAKKPLKFSFKKAQKMLSINESNQIAVIGDQVLTDILGANRCKMYSILVKPLQEKDILITRFNRKLEKRILKKYFKEEK